LGARGEHRGVGSSQTKKSTGGREGTSQGRGDTKKKVMKNKKGKQNAKRGVVTSGRTPDGPTKKKNGNQRTPEDHNQNSVWAKEEKRTTKLDRKPPSAGKKHPRYLPSRPKKRHREGEGSRPRQRRTMEKGPQNGICFLWGITASSTRGACQPGGVRLRQSMPEGLPRKSTKERGHWHGK